VIQGQIRTGRSKVDGFIVGEVIIDHTGKVSGSPLVAHYALANSRTLTLFGRTMKSSDWSPETLQKLGEFLTAVENDIARDVLEESPTIADQENNSHLPLGESGFPEL
jgi:hypothetical protein